jgi:hypothetical protein
MFKSNKKDESTATWSSATMDFPAPPAPVQFSARQLAYLHTVLGGQVMMAELTRADDESLKVMRGALVAVHSSMRDWWHTVEADVQTCTVSFTMPGSSEGKDG